MRQELVASLGKLVYRTLISVTLLVTPTFTLDPINPIKALALSALAFAGLGIFISSKSSFSLQSYKQPIKLISAFILWLFVVFGLSGGERLQQLFGTSGRNTGLITYLSFSIFFLISVFVASSDFFPRLIKASLVTGSASLLYGVIQINGLDPFPWQEIYSPVFGFLGNPNFQSSLLGVLGVLIFTQLLSKSISTRIKGFYLGYLLLSLYVIFKTESQQGLLVLLIGSATSLGLYIYKRNLKLGILYLISGILGFFGMLFGILNKGPLATILYKDSVTYRGDYWRAGWNMTLENPIFGVGLDSYGDWYRRSRTLEATIRRGPDVVSNAAHNVYLDISSSGGFPLLAAYLGLMVLVIVSAVKAFSREKTFNAGFVSIFAGWIAFQAQSVISINQIGLAIWGWVLAGLVIGYEINTRVAVTSEQEKKKTKLISKNQNGTATFLGVIIGSLAGLAIGLPTYLASAQHNSALNQTDVESVVQTAYIWPHEPIRMIQVATTLNDNNFASKGLEIILDATEKFPDNYAVWATLDSMKGATAQQKAQALSQMKRLDPLNPTLK